MIPVRNLFVMLAFAWHELAIFDDEHVGSCDFEKPFDVAARLLDAAAGRLLRRGLAIRYAEYEDTGARPRGAIDLARTLRERLTARGQLAYRFDDLTTDTPANRVLKAALRALLHESSVAPEVRMRLRRHVAWLAEVQDLSPREATRTHVDSARHERTYAEALWLSRLVLERFLPDEAGGGGGRSRPGRSSERLPAIFEGFVRGAARYFLGAEATVRARSLDWSVADATPSGRALLPGMRTDACLGWRDGTVTIVECKFNESPLVVQRFGADERLRAGHLYQLVTYLHESARRSPATNGVLVYAANGLVFDETMVLQGFRLRIVALDLFASWHELRSQLQDVTRWGATVGRASSSAVASVGHVLDG